MRGVEALLTFEVQESSLYPGYYASRSGVVYRREGGALVPRTQSRLLNRYLIVYVPTDDGRRIPRYVHRIVASAFIPNPLGYPCVLHADGTRDNNHASNLSWGTHKQNIADAIRGGTFPLGAKRWNAKLEAEDVLSIRSRGAAGESDEALAREYGVSRSHVHSIRSRRIWRHLP